MSDHEHVHPSKHHRREKFMEICLLVLLGREEVHGYKLMENLAEFGFSPDDLDVSTLYRTLRRMEKQGLVNSFWENSAQGPNKRMYTITETGQKSLLGHIEHIKRRMEFMQKLIRLYEDEDLS